MASVEKALLMLRNLPRVALNNVRDYPEVIRERKKQVLLSTPPFLNFLTKYSLNKLSR